MRPQDLRNLGLIIAAIAPSRSFQELMSVAKAKGLLPLLTSKYAFASIMSAMHVLGHKGAEGTSLSTHHRLMACCRRT